MNQDHTPHNSEGFNLDEILQDAATPKRIISHKILGNLFALVIVATVISVTSGVLTSSVLPKCDSTDALDALASLYREPINVGYGMFTKVDTGTLMSFRETFYQRKPGLRECQARVQATTLAGTPYATKQWVPITYTLEWEGNSKQHFYLSVIE